MNSCPGYCSSTVIGPGAHLLLFFFFPAPAHTCSQPDPTILPHPTRRSEKITGVFLNLLPHTHTQLSYHTNWQIGFLDLLLFWFVLCFMNWVLFILLIDSVLIYGFDYRLLKLTTRPFYDDITAEGDNQPKSGSVCFCIIIEGIFSIYFV